MKVKLLRKQFREDGIFGVLELEGFSFKTIEHSYKDENGVIYSKIPDGFYKCVKGIHKLGAKLVRIETFEVTGIKGRFGILFHTANYNKDVSGCIGIGLDISSTKSGDLMLINSKKAFDKFMDILKDVKDFNLSVETLK